jgi:protein-disulfide isomerase/uncharacterized membrane protein
MARARVAASLLLCLAGGALSLVLLSKHYGIPLLGEAALAACGEGGGCDIVAQSAYAVFAGLPLAAWGVFFYGSLLALLTPSLFATSEESHDEAASLGFFLVALAVLIDLILFGLQLAVIKAFCRFCVATYFVNLFLLGALWPHRQFARALNFFFTPAARRAFAAWVVSSLFVGVAAAALNAALADRKALASSPASILGIPSTIAAPQTPATPAEPPAKGSLEEQLAAAQAEAKKWKETLDDNRRLEIYLNQKARDDFNKAEPAKIDISASPFQGPKNAPISVVVYSDFMCPFCRDLAAGLKNFLGTSGGQVKIVYKHFPLDRSCNPGLGSTLHPGACELSLGGVCAEESGRFWEFHDKVFGQPRWDRATREDVLKMGASVGLDGASLGRCMDQAATKGRLTKDVEEGVRAGIESTPTIFVNGRKLSSTGVFLLALDEERKRLNLKAPTGAPQD